MYFYHGKSIDVIKIPSPEIYDWVKSSLEKDDGQLPVVNKGAFEFIPTAEGLLILNNWETFSAWRFKVRKDFGRYLTKLNKLIITQPNYMREKREEIKRNQKESDEWNFETILAKKEMRKEDAEQYKTFFLSDEVVIKMKGDWRPLSKKIFTKLTKTKRANKRDAESPSFNKGFIEKYWDGNYEDYKKFKQRAMKSGII
jgi:hypothetical protein